MKIPLPVRCVECGKDNTPVIPLDVHSLDFTCAHCGYDHHGPFDLRFTIGQRLLRRAAHELRVNVDPSMSIVFSAMALECEVSRLHHKWERIDGLLRMEEIPEDELNERLRRFQNIAAKIEGVAKLMHAPGLEDFIANNEELRDTISNGFQSIQLGSVVKDFQKQLPGLWAIRDA